MADKPTVIQAPDNPDENIIPWLLAKIELWQATIANLETRLAEAKQQERYFRTWLEEERGGSNGR
jgi:hypothetical protein